MGVDIKGHFSKNTQAWFVLASSLIVIIASSIECTDTKDCTGVKGWAVGASSVSLGFCFFYLIAAFFMESACETIAPYLATFLLVWWFPGAFILTFNGPFKMVGNGYFGSWASLIFSIQWFQVAGSGLFAKYTGGDTTSTNAGPYGGSDAYPAGSPSINAPAQL